ncbi:unnamed protein product, partial [Timema podura]|nr:unnamed protein product [Timema podura]
VPMCSVLYFKGITTGDVPVFSTVCLCLVRGEDIQFHNRLPGVNRDYLSTELCLSAANNLTYEPLCGSDGQTFHNLQAFRCYAAFFKVRQLSVRYGACVDHPEPNHCALAFVIWRRVCGQDNRTYSSVWELMCESQRMSTPIPVQYEGPCQHLCPVSMLYDPVCSTNMVEYPNIEAFQCDAARKPYNELSLLKEGPCPGKEEAICDGSVQDGGEVCGSNSITYSSLNQILCIRKHNPYLFILHDGACTLEDIKFSKEKAKICYFADNVPMHLPVCGTDNVTYSNPFIMRCAALRGHISEDVDIIHAGSCDTDQEKTPIKEDCDKITSKMALIDEPLFCASDGRSYYSTRHYNCAVNKNSDWFDYYITQWHATCQSIDVIVTDYITQWHAPCQSIDVIVTDYITQWHAPCQSIDVIVTDYITQWHATCQSIDVIVTDYITQWHAPCQSIDVIVTDYITQWHAPCQSIDAPCERLRSSQEGLLSQPLCASDGSSYVNSLALMCAITSQPDLTKRHKGACLPVVAPATIPPLQEDGEDT